MPDVNCRLVSVATTPMDQSFLHCSQAFNSPIFPACAWPTWWIANRWDVINRFQEVVIFTPYPTDTKLYNQPGRFTFLPLCVLIEIGLGSIEVPRNCIWMNVWGAIGSLSSLETVTAQFQYWQAKPCFIAASFPRHLSQHCLSEDTVHNSNLSSVVSSQHSSTISPRVICGLS